MKDLVISKELVSAVMGVNVVGVETDIKVIENNIFGGIQENEFVYFKENSSNTKKINLYEFIHKNCKEYAYSKGYEIIANRCHLSGMVETVLLKHERPHLVCSVDKRDRTLGESYENETIKACEWILKETNKSTETQQEAQKK